MCRFLLLVVPSRAPSSVGTASIPDSQAPATGDGSVADDAPAPTDDGQASVLTDQDESAIGSGDEIEIDPTPIDE